MHRQSVIAAGLLILVFALVVSAGHGKGWRPLSLLNSGITQWTKDRNQLVASDIIALETNSPTAPEFASGTWINSEPLTVKGLRGRVVLVDFWTFGCYNCRNTLPFIKQWHERYSDKGLTIVGVHSPEFDTEKK